MYVPPLSKINKVLIITYVGMFLLSQVLRASLGVDLASIFGLSANGLKSGFLFQLITFPLIDKGLMGVVFNALILWFIGSELETKWGNRFYIKFLLIVTLACSLIFATFSLLGPNTIGFIPLHGLTGINLALLVAYGIIYSERTMIFMFIFPMKAKYFCMLLAGIEIFMAMSSSAFNTAWGHVISMGAGFLYLKYMSFKAQGLGLKNIIENHQRHKAHKKNKGNLRLVKDPEEDAPNPDEPKYWQ